MGDAVMRHSCKGAARGVTAMLAVLVAAATVWCAAAHGQSSSLFVSQPAQQPAPQPGLQPGLQNPVVQNPGLSSAPQRFQGSPPTPAVYVGHRDSPLSPSIAATSFAAITPAAPRVFALRDLVTIIVREQTEAAANARLETSKDFDMSGQVPQFPNLSLDKLIRFIFEPAVTDPEQAPAVRIGFNTDFDGDGKYARKDSFTARITAEVVDIKPNGNLVLEARKFIRSDKETIAMVLTGVCRGEDVAADNTVLSTQLFDLRLEKDHSGELRRATKKGLLTRLFETIFNF
jgi:flagellar L-ring protein FlgH